MMMTEAETDLIRGLREQSPLAQQWMLERYGKDVFAQVARLIPGLENAEEVYQDVFVKVFRNIKKYDPEKSSLRTWISRIAYNESITFLRHKRQPVVYFEEHEALTGKLSGTDALSETEVDETFGRPNPETVQLIRDAMKHLPPEEQAIITMFYYEEMSLKEIAYVTESLQTTVASKLCRTRKKLYKIIKMLQS
jgi:RNA polymerase sigma-70 factor (ECF subfamily)